MRAPFFSIALICGFVLVVTPGAAQALCGNGRVDAGELCDPTVQWADRCPAPWGLCWVCTPNCNGRVLSSSDEFVGLMVVPFCSERSQAPRTEHHYDAHGHITRYDHDGTAHWTFTYDANGDMIEQHARIGSNPTEHLFRAWSEGRVIRAWLDNDLDGTPERSWHFEYTPERRLDRVWSTPSTPGRLPDSDRRYSYDRNGRVVVDETRFGDATWHSTDTFAYDARGRQVYARHVGEPRSHDSECRTHWDAMGSTHRCEVGAPGERPTVRIVRRDTHGHAIWQVSRDVNGTRTERHVELAHDRYGNVIAEAELDERGRVLRRIRRRYDAATGLAVREFWVEARQVNYERDFRCLATLLPRVPWRSSTPAR